MSDLNNTLPKQSLSVRFSHAGPLLIAGLCEPLTSESHKSIPRLWQQLARRSDEIPHCVNSVGYGLCINNHGFHYLAGHAVWDFADLSPGINHITLPAQTYGIFSHSGNVTEICNTIDEIFDSWLPQSGYTLNTTDSPLHFFERYGEAFDPASGLGDIEIWLPLNNPE